MRGKIDIPDVTLVTQASSSKLSIRQPEVSFVVMIYGEYLGRRFTIRDEEVLIGRAPHCDIVLTDDSVSRMHCRLIPGSAGVVISDLNSTNGTYVNGASISTHLLRDSDKIKIGRSIFKFLSGNNIEHAYHEEIYRLKTTDGLTGAYNKRYFEEEAEREIYRFCRYSRPLSLLMIDIDYFKKVNDNNGHLAGDRVLTQLSQLMMANVRREDTFCRYGGEEFALLMPETNIKGALDQAEKLRVFVQAARIEFEGMVLRVTISIGVTQAEPGMSTVDAFVRVADENLYKAKDAGRNRVVPSPS
ncbi:MAG: diguanylate cyclase [Myxococcota bacterium]|jgi:diguanylate cyclase (GGDEF)-like protein|nr:diguanylate cyclase [Myxococcota bacterium]